MVHHFSGQRLIHGGPSVQNRLGLKEYFFQFILKCKNRTVKIFHCTIFADTYVGVFVCVSIILYINMRMHMYNNYVEFCIAHTYSTYIHMCAIMLLCCAHIRTYTAIVL